MKVLCILLYVAFASGFCINNNETHEDKIVGGAYVGIGDVPYQANLFRFIVDNFCGATIIHESWVITASHCVKHHQSHISVRTGSGSRKTSGKVHRVEQIIPYEDYDTKTKNNDIALIKLTEPIQFNNEQRPIKLAKPHDIPKTGEFMRISGFGMVGVNLGDSNFLKAAYIPIRSQEYCKRVYLPFHITDNMLCAGNGGADPCSHDSGGPGVIHGKLYGIISFGVQCNSTRHPGVFTRVPKYYDWIEEKTGLRF